MKSWQGNVVQSGATKPPVVVLFNRCRACRAVVVERAGRGGARKSQTFAVAGGSYVPLAAPGVPVQARIVTEKPCG